MITYTTIAVCRYLFPLSLNSKTLGCKSWVLFFILFNLGKILPVVSTADTSDADLYSNLHQIRLQQSPSIPPLESSLIITSYALTTFCNFAGNIIVCVVKTKRHTEVRHIYEGAYDKRRLGLDWFSDDKTWDVKTKLS